MESSESKYSLWGGRFDGGQDDLMKRFNQSISIDKRLWAEDITASKAWAVSIQKVGILTSNELTSILEGLELVYNEWASGKFELKPTDEDIHTANERRLKEIIGDSAMKLHTGRSRNDQVVTDIKLWLKKYLTELQNHLTELLNTFILRAENEIDILMPGYSHLQRAQPIRWSNLLLSYVCALDRDLQRLKQTQERLNTCPLGCGALAGNPFDVDRETLASLLNFKSCSINSIDSIQSRDFIYEFIFVCSSIAVNLSKLAEDFIIYSSKEFSFIELSDSYSTGSSIMPQKKNPDSLELIRAKCSRIFGKLNNIMSLLKGLPTSYNKDLQEDKEALFDTADTINFMVQITNGVVKTLVVNKEKMSSALSVDLLATDLAYYLVRKGVPFRLAHSYSGRCVALAEKLKCNLNELSLEQLKFTCELFDSDVEKIYNFENSVEQYNSVGGTAKNAVLMQIEYFKNIYCKVNK